MDALLGFAMILCLLTSVLAILMDEKDDAQYLVLMAIFLKVMIIG